LSSWTFHKHDVVMVQKMLHVVEADQFGSMRLRPYPSIAEGLALVPFFVAFAYAMLAPYFSNFFMAIVQHQHEPARPRHLC
jgi:hypothetical protein